LSRIEDELSISSETDKGAGSRAKNARFCRTPSSKTAKSSAASPVTSRSSLSVTDRLRRMTSTPAWKVRACRGTSVCPRPATGRLTSAATAHFWKREGRRAILTPAPADRTTRSGERRNARRGFDDSWNPPPNARTS
jgi:hypothetical protein